MNINAMRLNFIIEDLTNSTGFKANKNLQSTYYKSFGYLINHYRPYKSLSKCFVTHLHGVCNTLVNILEIFSIHRYLDKNPENIPLQTGAALYILTAT
jgi:hypothetical protein